MPSKAAWRARDAAVRGRAPGKRGLAPPRGLWSRRRRPRAAMASARSEQLLSHTAQEPWGCPHPGVAPDAPPTACVARAREARSQRERDAAGVRARANCIDVTTRCCAPHHRHGVPAHLFRRPARIVLIRAARGGVHPQCRGCGGRHVRRRCRGAVAAPHRRVGPGQPSAAARHGAGPRWHHAQHAGARKRRRASLRPGPAKDLRLLVVRQKRRCALSGPRAGVRTRSLRRAAAPWRQRGRDSVGRRQLGTDPRA